MLRVLGDAHVIPILNSDLVSDNVMESEDPNEKDDDGGAECPLHKLSITPKRNSNTAQIAQEPEPQQRKRKRDTNSIQKKKRNHHHHRRHSHSADRTSVSTARSSSGNSSNADNDHIGHHSGVPGSKIKDRYSIISQIGIGTFGKVFHCHDNKHDDKVAVKAVRSIARYVDSARIEADILDHVYDCQAKQKTNYCLKLYSHFELDKHYFLVTEKLGPSLYDVMKINNYRGFPMRLIRHIARQLLQAMRFLQGMNLIHTDLKVENVLFVGDLPALLSSTDAENISNGNGDGDGDGASSSVTATGDGGAGQQRHSGRSASGRQAEVYPPCSLIKIIDFGGATYDNEKKSTTINTRQYRSPEVLLETKWSFPSDIWSVGCIIAEIYGGGLLFQTHNNLEHLALIERCCGLFPFGMLKASPVSDDYFDRRGNCRVSRLNSDSQRHVRSMQRVRDFFAPDRKRRNRSGIADLMKELLEIDPYRRATAHRALQMPFVR